MADVIPLGMEEDRRPCCRGEQERDQEVGRGGVGHPDTVSAPATTQALGSADVDR